MMRFFQLISLLNHKKAIRKNDDDTKFIKHGKTVIAPILCKFYNACLMQGEFSEFLKVAKVIPIHKKETKTELPTTT